MQLVQHINKGSAVFVVNEWTAVIQETERIFIFRVIRMEEPPSPHFSFVHAMSLGLMIRGELLYISVWF